MSENEIKTNNDFEVGLYSVVDRVAGFNNVMTVKNDALAIRSFKNAVLAENSMFKENPEDYCLTRVARMKTQSGAITEDYEELCEAWEVIKEAKKYTGGENVVKS